MEGKGFSLIEVLSACPTNWGLTPWKALQWLDDNMIPIIRWAYTRTRRAE
jgi:2-oxoglutarate ferredoxin oxidoreductase subunit beta